MLVFIASDNARYLAVLPQRIFSQLDIFALMAMVLFIMTGEVMNRTGVTRYLINFSMSIVGRPGYELDHLREMYGNMMTIVNVDAPDISASVIRDMVKAGYSIRHLVPVDVDEYIMNHGLYIRREDRAGED